MPLFVPPGLSTLYQNLVQQGNQKISAGILCTVDNFIDKKRAKNTKFKAKLFKQNFMVFIIIFEAAVNRCGCFGQVVLSRLVPHLQFISYE